MQMFGLGHNTGSPQTLWNEIPEHFQDMIQYSVVKVRSQSIDITHQLNNHT